MKLLVWKCTGRHLSNCNMKMNTYLLIKITKYDENNEDGVTVNRNGNRKSLLPHYNDQNLHIEMP